MRWWQALVWRASSLPQRNAPNLVHDTGQGVGKSTTPCPCSLCPVVLALIPHNHRILVMRVSRGPRLAPGQAEQSFESQIGMSLCMAAADPGRRWCRCREKGSTDGGRWPSSATTPPSKQAASWMVRHKHQETVVCARTNWADFR